MRRISTRRITSRWVASRRVTSLRITSLRVTLRGSGVAWRHLVTRWHLRLSSGVTWGNLETCLLRGVLARHGIGLGILLWVSLGVRLLRICLLLRISLLRISHRWHHLRLLLIASSSVLHRRHLSGWISVSSGCCSTLWSILGLYQNLSA